MWICPNLSILRLFPSLPLGNPVKQMIPEVLFLLLCLYFFSLLPHYPLQHLLLASFFSSFYQNLFLEKSLVIYTFVWTLSQWVSTSKKDLYFKHCIFFVEWTWGTPHICEQVGWEM